MLPKLLISHFRASNRWAWWWGYLVTNLSNFFVPRAGEHVVAPVNKAFQTKECHVGNTPPMGDVQRLLGNLNASAKMAPGVHECLRFLLEQQQIGNKEFFLAMKILGNHFQVQISI